MIAVPTPFVIQRDEEQIGAVERFQGCLTVGTETYSIAERAAQAVEDGGLQEESLHALGLSVQDFLDQIIQHKAMAAGKGIDEVGGVMLAALQ